MSMDSFLAGINNSQNRPNEKSMDDFLKELDNASKTKTTPQTQPNQQVSGEMSEFLNRLDPSVEQRVIKKETKKVPENLTEEQFIYFSKEALKRRMDELSKRLGQPIQYGQFYRDLYGQAVAYEKYIKGQGPPANKPGHSKHQLGMAVDLKSIGGDVETFRKEAVKAGLLNPRSEWWHYALPLYKDKKGKVMDWPYPEFEDMKKQADGSYLLKFKGQDWIRVSKGKKPEIYDPFKGKGPVFESIRYETKEEKVTVPRAVAYQDYWKQVSNTKEKAKKEFAKYVETTDIKEWPFLYTSQIGGKIAPKTVETRRRIVSGMNFEDIVGLDPKVKDKIGVVSSKPYVVDSSEFKDKTIYRPGVNNPVLMRVMPGKGGVNYSSDFAGLNEALKRGKEGDWIGKVKNKDDEWEFLYKHRNKIVSQRVWHPDLNQMMMGPSLLSKSLALLGKLVVTQAPFTVPLEYARQTTAAFTPPFLEKMYPGISATAEKPESIGKIWERTMAGELTPSKATFTRELEKIYPGMSEITRMAIGVPALAQDVVQDLIWFVEPVKWVAGGLTSVKIPKAAEYFAKQGDILFKKIPSLQRAVAAINHQTSKLSFVAKYSANIYQLEFARTMAYFEKQRGIYEGLVKAGKEAEAAKLTDEMWITAKRINEMSDKVIEYGEKAKVARPELDRMLATFGRPGKVSGKFIGWARKLGEKKAPIALPAATPETLTQAVPYERQRGPMRPWILPLTAGTGTAAAVLSSPELQASMEKDKDGQPTGWWNNLGTALIAGAAIAGVTAPFAGWKRIGRYLKGWRAGETGEKFSTELGRAFGATEGRGLYVSREKNLAEFFEDIGKAIRRVKFRKPKNPLFINEEPLYLLNEDPIIFQRIKPTDSKWLKANKMAVRAAKATPINFTLEVEAKVEDELTKVIESMGHDGLLVRSGGEEWAVLFNPKRWGAPGNKFLASAVGAVGGVGAYYALPEDQRKKFPLPMLVAGGVTGVKFPEYWKSIGNFVHAEGIAQRTAEKIIRAAGKLAKVTGRDVLTFDEIAKFIGRTPAVDPLAKLLDLEEAAVRGALIGPEQVKAAMRLAEKASNNAVRIEGNAVFGIGRVSPEVLTENTRQLAFKSVSETLEVAEKEAIERQIERVAEKDLEISPSQLHPGKEEIAAADITRPVILQRQKGELLIVEGRARMLKAREEGKKIIDATIVEESGEKSEAIIALRKSEATVVEEQRELLSRTLVGKEKKKADAVRKRLEEKGVVLDIEPTRAELASSTRFVVKLSTGDRIAGRSWDDVEKKVAKAYKRLTYDQIMEQTRSEIIGRVERGLYDEARALEEARNRGINVASYSELQKRITPKRAYELSEKAETTLSDFIGLAPEDQDLLTKIQNLTRIPSVEGEVSGGVRKAKRVIEKTDRDTESVLREIAENRKFIDMPEESLDILGRISGLTQEISRIRQSINQLTGETRAAIRQLTKVSADDFVDQYIQAIKSGSRDLLESIGLKLDRIIERSKLPYRDANAWAHLEFLRGREANNRRIALKKFFDIMREKVIDALKIAKPDFEKVIASLTEDYNRIKSIRDAIERIVIKTPKGAVPINMEQRGNAGRLVALCNDRMIGIKDRIEWLKAEIEHAKWLATPEAKAQTGIGPRGPRSSLGSVIGAASALTLGYATISEASTELKDKKDNSSILRRAALSIPFIMLAGVGVSKASRSIAYQLDKQFTKEVIKRIRMLRKYEGLKKTFPYEQAIARNIVRRNQLKIADIFKLKEPIAALPLRPKVIGEFPRRGPDTIWTMYKRFGNSMWMGAKAFKVATRLAGFDPSMREKLVRWFREKEGEASLILKDHKDVLDKVAGILDDIEDNKLMSWNRIILDDKLVEIKDILIPQFHGGHPSIYEIMGLLTEGRSPINGRSLGELQKKLIYELDDDTIYSLAQNYGLITQKGGRFPTRIQKGKVGPATKGQVGFVPVDFDQLRQKLLKDEKFLGSEINPQAIEIAREDNFKLAEALGYDSNALRQAENEARALYERAGIEISTAFPRIAEEVARIRSEGGYLHRMYLDMEDMQGAVNRMRKDAKVSMNEGKYANAQQLMEDASRLESKLENVRATVSGHVTGSVPQGILTHRVPLTEKERAYMDEILDARYRMMAGGVEHAESISTKHFVDKIDSEFAISNEQYIKIPSDAPEKKAYLQIPETARWESLRGKWVPRLVHEVLLPAGMPLKKATRIDQIVHGLMSWGYAPDLFTEAAKGPLGFYQRNVVQLWKKIVLSPANIPFHLRNPIGNMYMLAMESDRPFNLSALRKAMGSLRAKDEFYWNELVKNGAISSWGNEAQILDDIVDGIGTITPEKLRKIFNFQPEGSLFKTIKKYLIENPSALFQTNENFWKAYVYTSERISGKSGVQAAEIAQRAGIYYRDVPKITRWMSRNAVLSPFPTFWQKAGGQFVRALIHRPARIATVTKFVRAPMKMIPEWEYEALPDYMKNGIYIPMPFRNPDGSRDWFNLGYIIPFSDVLEPITFLGGMADVADKWLSGTGSIKDVGLEFGKLLQTNPAINLVNAIYQNQDPLTKGRIYNIWSSDEGGRRRAILEYVARIIPPVRNYMNVIPMFAKVPIEQSIWALAGARYKDIHPLTSVRRQLKSVNAQYRELQSEVISRFRAPGKDILDITTRLSTTRDEETIAELEKRLKETESKLSEEERNKLINEYEPTIQSLLAQRERLVELEGFIMKEMNAKE